MNVIRLTQLGAHWANDEVVLGQEKGPFNDLKVRSGGGTASPYDETISGSVSKTLSSRLCQAVVPPSVSAAGNGTTQHKRWCR